MKKFFLFWAGLLMGIIFFMPKDNLYYTFQKYLAKNNIYINSDINNAFALKLKNGEIYQNGINLASFKEIKILPYLFFNEILSNNIDIDFQNLKINQLKITYSILNPIKIYIKGISNFGKIEGEVNLIKRFCKIYIYNLTNNSLKSFLTKDKKGYFYYAKF